MKLLVEPIHNKIKMKRIKGMKSFTECLLVVDRLLLGSSMVVVGDSRSIFGFRLKINECESLNLMVNLLEHSTHIIK